MELDLSKIKKAFFVGVGGIGISAVARLLLSQGVEVYGSDIGENNVVTDLKDLGLKFSSGQSVDLIPEDVDLISYTVAINTYEPNLLPSIKNKFSIPIKSYPEMLGILTKDKFTIAVSGTHGKTTTTAMIAKVLMDSGRDPSVIVGSLLSGSNSNLVIGKSDIFVVEACEYERDFLHLNPSILVITNIEAEHLDYYKDLADIETAFSELVAKTKNLVIADFGNPNLQEVCKDFKGELSNYMSFVDSIPKLSVPGEHNRLDAACAYAVGRFLDIPKESIDKSLVDFRGTWRRLEKKGETAEGVIVYDDYAHHPTEIKASLQGLRELFPKTTNRLVVVFQPHLYSRTKALFQDFVTAFDLADEVVFLPIYFAREAPDPDISSQKLAEAVSAHGVKALSVVDFSQAEDLVRSMSLQKGDIFVTMGAGEAYKVANHTFDLN